jgi:primosomal protein N'
MEKDRYIRVILPLKLAWEPCYRISEEVRTGMRVSVTFSGRKYTGVVSGTDAVPDVDRKRILPVNAVERHMEPIGEKELALWRFMADYYLCTIGEVYKLAYPAAKIAGEEVRARAEERRELMKARAKELYRKRILGLEERLAKKEASLAGKHNAKVTAELEAGRDRILAEIREVRQKLEALGSADGCKPGEAEGRRGDPYSFAMLGITDAGSEPGTAGETVIGVKKAFDEGRTVLLQGGKVRLEVILETIRETLAAGLDVFMLVPEISLSKKLQSTLRKAFGEALLVFHSGESAGNRREVATALRRGDRPRLVLGTRSALFLPFRNLGLVVVEEEHDIAYKQDGTPRYGARDTAVMLGSIHGARVLLSSPTPSLESLYNCLSGRYTLVRMPLEESVMEIVDTSVEARKNGMVGDLSRILIARIGEALKNGGEVLILRPWGPFDDLEEQVGKLFLESRRVHFSTVHEARRADLGGIALLALLNADTLMDKHDFRADEKTIQTLEQFRGRLSGHMLVQTRQGNHPVFLMGEDYSLHLLEERRAFHLPPYTRMVDVIVRDANARRLAKLSALLAGSLGAYAPGGPFAPFRGREQEQEARVIRIMLPRDRRLPASKKEIAAIIGDFEQTCKYTGHITLDVDPV